MLCGEGVNGAGVEGELLREMLMGAFSFRGRVGFVRRWERVWARTSERPERVWKRRCVSGHACGDFEMELVVFSKVFWGNLETSRELCLGWI